MKVTTCARSRAFSGFFRRQHAQDFVLLLPFPTHHFMDLPALRVAIVVSLVTLSATCLNLLCVVFTRLYACHLEFKAEVPTKNSKVENGDFSAYVHSRQAPGKMQKILFSHANLGYIHRVTLQKLNPKKSQNARGLAHFDRI